MLTFATEEDLARWSDGNIPDNPRPLIRHASVMVQHAIRFARFSVTPAGLPSDPDIAEAVRDAVCAQVEAWAVSKINPTQIATTGVVTGSKIGDASFTFDAASSANTASNARTELCNEAWLILENAGLIGGKIWTRY